MWYKTGQIHAGPGGAEHLLAGGRSHPVVPGHSVPLGLRITHASSQETLVKMHLLQDSECAESVNTSQRRSSVQLRS